MRVFQSTSGEILLICKNIYVRFISTCQSQELSYRQTRFYFRTTPVPRSLQEMVILLTEVRVHS